MGKLPPRVRLKKLDEELKSQCVSPESQALVLVGQGKNEEAIGWLEKGERENAAMSHLNVDPAVTPLRFNPRFQQLVQGWDSPLQDYLVGECGISSALLGAFRG